MAVEGYITEVYVCNDFIPGSGPIGSYEYWDVKPANNNDVFAPNQWMYIYLKVRGLERLRWKLKFYRNGILFEDSLSRVYEGGPEVPYLLHGRSLNPSIMSTGYYKLEVWLMIEAELEYVTTKYFGLGTPGPRPPFVKPPKQKGAFSPAIRLLLLK